MKAKNTLKILIENKTQVQSINWKLTTILKRYQIQDFELQELEEGYRIETFDSVNANQIQRLFDELETILDVKIDWFELESSLIFENSKVKGKQLQEILKHVANKFLIEKINVSVFDEYAHFKIHNNPMCGFGRYYKLIEDVVNVANKGVKNENKH